MIRKDFIDQIRADDGDGDGLHQVLTDRVHPGDKKIRAAAVTPPNRVVRIGTATRSRQA
jgi:hypothetical protein